MAKVNFLEKKAHQLRTDMLEMCIGAGDGHVTSSLSCTDIMTALFYGGIMKHNPNEPDLEDRDRFILSKGQASPMLYTVLADRGYFDKSEMKKFAQSDGMFGVHLQKSVPGAEITCGSLGMGFGNAVGIALGAKLNHDLHLTFTLLGDGHLILSKKAIFQYKQSEYYSPGEQFTIKYNDPEYNIWWPINNPILSKRDQCN